MDQDIEYVPKTNVTKLPKLWHVPGVIRFFTGRENELNLLKHHLRRPNAKIKLTGTGGVGKSQIAIKLIHDLVDEQLFSYAIMLNANSHNHDQLSVEFIELAKTLEIHIKDNPHFVQDALNELSNRGPTLLVLDDATRFEDIQNYLPKTLSNISVIITTRDNQDWANDIQSITVDLFSLSEATSFLLHVTQQDQHRVSEAQELAMTLGRFPLALAQAAGYILTRNIGLQQYLNLYEEKARNQVSLLAKSPIKGDPHQEAIWITVNLCLEAINNANALRILQFCAILAPEVPIANELLSYWLSTADLSRDAIGALQNFSLLTHAGHSEHIKVHQIVQTIVILIDQSFLNFTNFKITVSHLGEFFELARSEVENEQRKFKLVPHMVKIIEHLSSVPEINPSLKDHSVALMKYYLGICYAKMYQFEKAYKQLNESLASFLQFGDDNPLIAACYSTLASTAHSLHKMEEALEFSVSALSLQERLLGKHSAELIPTLNSIATIYMDLGLLEPAIEILDRALQLNREANATRGDLLCNKANCLSELDRNDEALEIYHQVRILDEQIYTEKHLKSVTTLLNLAEVMGKVDDVYGQISLLEHCLKILTTIADQSHPLYAAGLNQLAVAQGEIGQHEAKIALLLKAKKINEEQNNQAELANNLINLGNAYADTRQNSLALPCFTQALAIHKAVFGPQSPKTALAIASYAMSLGDTGNLDTCIKQLNEALKIFITCFGQEHQLVQQTKMNIAMAKKRKSRTEHPGGFFNAAFFDAHADNDESLSRTNGYH